MITPDLSAAAWRKAIRSGTNANCVEVAQVPGTIWRKSARSGTNSDCVEVAEVAQVVAVRDSKDPGGPVLAFTRPTWSAFIASGPRRRKRLRMDSLP